MVPPRPGERSARRLGRALVAAGLGLTLVGGVPLVAAEVAYAAAPPKPRCKVVPDATPRPKTTEEAGNVVLTIPRVVCVRAARPAVIGGQGGGNAQGGPRSPGSGGIPFTGFDLLTVAAAGLLALTSGALSLLAGRRRAAPS